jgi:DNA-binding NtrC family response regulator
MVCVYFPRGGKGQVRWEGEPPLLESATPIEEQKTVLVVEDDAGVRMLAVRVLASYGYRVLEAGNGKQALQLGLEHEGPIDVLITDVIMPQMNGRELVEKLHHVRPSMAILYMSGYADDALPTQGGLPADTGFLAKPFTVEGLIGKVQSTLEERRARREQDAGA